MPVLSSSVRTPSGPTILRKKQHLSTTYRQLPERLFALNASRTNIFDPDLAAPSLVLRADREKVLIATKWGNVFDEESKQLTGTNICSGYVREACEASLRRLGTDRIDIFQLHVGDLELDRLPTIVEELEKLRTSGKIRSFGWSTDDPQRAESILRFPGAEVVQFELNVLQVAASRKRR